MKCRNTSTVDKSSTHLNTQQFAVMIEINFASVKRFKTISKKRQQLEIHNVPIQTTVNHERSHTACCKLTTFSRLARTEERLAPVGVAVKYGSDDPRNATHHHT